MDIRRRLFFLTLLGVLFGRVVWGTAQQSGQMSGHNVMMDKRASSAQQADHVASVYAKLCASCHGEEGEGDGPAIAMNPKPGDFTECERMATHSDKMLFEIIKEGGQPVGHSPMMPPWKSALTDSEIRDLVTYVRNFCKT